MIPAWAWVLLMFTLFYRISNPKTQGAVGIGGFFLMRRTLLERVGGYEALKDEVLEDVRLAEMIKRSGARLLIELRRTCSAHACIEISARCGSAVPRIGSRG